MAFLCLWLKCIKVSTPLHLLQKLLQQKLPLLFIVLTLCLLLFPAQTYQHSSSLAK
jgi:hypothetical protein